MRFINTGLVLAAFLGGALHQGDVQAAGTVPVPGGKMVSYKITMSDGTWIKAKSIEGEDTRITSGDSILAVSPYVQDMAKNVVMFKVFEIRKVNGEEAIKLVDSVEQQKGQDAAITQSHPSLELSLQSIVEAPASNEASK